MVTSFDVAKFAGVSQATVSRALRNDSRVSEKTRLLVQEAAKTLGYVPNAAGRALSSGRTDRIGLLVTDLHNEFYHRIIAPIAEKLHQLDKELVLLLVDSDGAETPNRVQSLGLDGVILGTTTTDSFVPFHLRERDIPFVYFNRTSPTVLSDSATVDGSVGFLDMLQAVIEKGHRDLGLISGPTNSTTGQGRSDALRGFLAARGIKIADDHRVTGDFSVESGISGFRKLWALKKPPTAIICGNDTIAMGVVNEAFRQGVAIPDEVSVVGFDNIKEASLPVYGLASVGYDMEQLAYEAVELLLARIDNKNAPFQHRTVQSYFVLRGSLGVPREY